MNQGGYGDNSYRINIGKLRMVVTAELLRAIRDTHHIDELFQWLSPAIVQYFSAPVVQFWVAPEGYQGQVLMKLVAQSAQDNSLRHRLTLDKPVADLAENIRNRQTELALCPVGNVFSSYQTTLLQRYGLYYCFGDYLNSKGRPASSIPTVPGQATLMPIEAVALLFFSQPPHPELQRSISYILKLAMQIAATNGLLSLPNNAQGYKLQLQQASLSALSELVPHRKQDAELMTTNNPLADPIIADRLTRDLYRYIDGRKNVQELCAVTHLGLKEVAVALRTLLAERRIELFDSSGQLKNGLSLLNNL